MLSSSIIGKQNLTYKNSKLNHGNYLPQFSQFFGVQDPILCAYPLCYYFTQMWITEPDPSPWCNTICFVLEFLRPQLQEISLIFVTKKFLDLVDDIKEKKRGITFEDP